MDESAAAAAAVRGGRFYCSLFFLAAGVGIGSWASSLPVLSAQMHLDKSHLGLILVCFAFGAIATMTNVGRLSNWAAFSTLSLGGSLLFGAALILIPQVGNAAWLALLVFLAGAGFGTLDVSMNTDASSLERRSGRHMMSSFHAVFSFGNLAGAFAVGQILSHGGALAVCLGVTGVGVGVLAIVAKLGWGRTKNRGEGAQPHGSSTRLDRSLRKHLYLLGALAFLGMLAEGGLLDWSAIYVVTVAGGAESTGAYGLAVFATMMAVGRLFGDALAARIGPTRLLRYGAALCACALCVLLVSSSMPVVFVALAVCGLGVANIVPSVFAAAGRTGAAAAGHAMSIVSTIGYAGLLLGPGLLGFVAQLSSLVGSFCVIVLSFVVISFAARLLGRR